MPVQQNKVSKHKVRMRKASLRYSGLQVGKCSHCEQPAQSHRVCPHCGYYKGLQIKQTGG